MKTIHNDMKRTSLEIRWEGMSTRDHKGARESSGSDGKIIILTIMVVSRVYTYVKTHQLVHIIFVKDFSRDTCFFRIDSGCFIGFPK